MFDGMAPLRMAKRRKVSEKVDRLSSLRDELVRRVLSFLPSREAVLASLLSRRWRGQWKHLRTLRVMDSKHCRNANELNKFVNHFLLMRKPLPLDVVEIKSYDHCTDSEEAFRYIAQWVRYALSSEVKALRICIMQVDMMMYDEVNVVHWMLPRKLLVSKTLVKLELTRVESAGISLEFSGCPLLKDVKMEFCNLFIARITSPSLAHLSITYCDFVSTDRTQISTPNLVSLQLVDCWERTPLLESMPKLVSAFVRLRHCSDYCANGYESGDCGHDSCEGCYGSILGNRPGVLLQGLSCATNLELTAKKTFIFRRDLTRCPVFSKLKTLLLNDWCVTGNLDALICFLQHSPALENLILQLTEIPEDLLRKVDDQPLAMEHLAVEVKYNNLDGRIHEIVEALKLYGVHKITTGELPKQIISRSQDFWPPGSLSFEQERT